MRRARMKSTSACARRQSASSKEPPRVKPPLAFLPELVLRSKTHLCELFYVRETCHLYLSLESWVLSLSLDCHFGNGRESLLIRNGL